MICNNLSVNEQGHLCFAGVDTVEMAKKHGRVLLRTGKKTSDFMSSLIIYLQQELAPRITRHGVLLDIYGEGVLLMGESGVGKEFFPQIIHTNSIRKHGKYIAVNCGAIPEGTIDSELFGHIKGAFTGAVNERSDLPTTLAVAAVVS